MALPRRFRIDSRFTRDIGNTSLCLTMSPTQQFRTSVLSSIEGRVRGYLGCDDDDPQWVVAGLGAPAVVHSSSMKTPRATTTLGDLHRATPWLNCERCQHYAPLACAVAVIRWGAGASSDVLRERVRCTQCGNKGATIQHPG
jgi:hypothetical protein